MPLLALARPIDAVIGKVLEGADKTMGGIPGPLNRIGFQLSSIDKHLTKPISILTHADDLDFLGQLADIDIPVLCVAGMSDTLAPRVAVEHLLDLVTGSPSAELVEAPGGHDDVARHRRLLRPPRFGYEEEVVSRRRQAQPRPRRVRGRRPARDECVRAGSRRRAAPWSPGTAMR